MEELKSIDKQIEEMAVICGACDTTCDECFGAFEKIMTLPAADRSEYCQAIKYAKRLFNAGCRMYKDGVVLTEREHEIAMRNQYDVGFQFGSKKTAEKYKVAMMLSIQEMQKYLEITEEQAKILYQHNNEIAKQFAVE